MVWFPYLKTGWMDIDLGHVFCSEVGREDNYVQTMAEKNSESTSEL